MRNKLPTPHKEAVFFENEKVYACLANFPITKGHVVVVWKEPVEDLHLLSRSEYELLMNTVDMIRDVMLQVLHIEKVYLIYMDEVKHVHWHLVPRYNEKGFDVFEHEPGKLTDFSLAHEFKKLMQK